MKFPLSGFVPIVFKRPRLAFSCSENNLHNPESVPNSVRVKLALPPHALSGASCLNYLKSGGGGSSQMTVHPFFFPPPLFFSF